MSSYGGDRHAQPSGVQYERFKKPGREGMGRDRDRDAHPSFGSRQEPFKEPDPGKNNDEDTLCHGWTILWCELQGDYTGEIIQVPMDQRFVRDSAADFEFFVLQ